MLYDRIDNLLTQYAIMATEHKLRARKQTDPDKRGYEKGISGTYAHASTLLGESLKRCNKALKRSLEHDLRTLQYCLSVDEDKTTQEAIDKSCIEHLKKIIEELESALQEEE